MDLSTWTRLRILRMEYNRNKSLTKNALKSSNYLNNFEEKEESKLTNKLTIRSLPFILIFKDH